MAVQDAWPELIDLLGDRVSRSKSDLDQHAASETYYPDALPDAVAYPTDTQEVSELVKICAAHGIAVTGWGAGTSLEGQAQAFSGGVVVDFSQMDAIVEVSQANMDARVQPGLTREALNEELRATGLFFPVDPGANATLGGMAATRASGTTAVRYGTMRDNILTPPSGLFDCGGQNLISHWFDQACLLGKTDKLIGKNSSTFRVLPSNESFC